jgi:hypothetical protein
MQAHGAEILRLALCLATERGIKVCAPVHDAILVEAPTDKIEAVVAEVKAIWAEASKVVIGFELGSDATIVRYPDRYVENDQARGMWDTIMRHLEAIEGDGTENARATEGQKLPEPYIGVGGGGAAGTFVPAPDGVPPIFARGGISDRSPSPYPR